MNERQQNWLGERRIWLNKLDRRDQYISQKKELGTCLLCGNRYPKTPKYFMEVGADDLHGVIKSGLAYVCLMCKADWGKLLKDDVNKVVEEAKENLKAGKKKNIIPLAKR